MFRARHLSDERLFDCYLTEQCGEPAEPPVAEHLADCQECRTRYAALARFMDGLRVEADAELDEAFPADRLRVQQQQIMRRIDHLACPTRIISFPGHSPDVRATASRTRVAPRWLAAAAAAGLLLGIAAGSRIYPGGSAAPPAEVSRAGGAPAAALAIGLGGPEPSTDLDFLLELEYALERPHTRELTALDALTPHVLEAGYQLR
jgi:hypothetical protein